MPSSTRAMKLTQITLPLTFNTICLCYHDLAPESKSEGN